MNDPENILIDLTNKTTGIMDDNASNKDEKRTLIGAYDRLQSKVDQMENLCRTCETLIEKMERTEDFPKPEPGPQSKEEQKQPDIVGMFYGLSDRIEIPMARMGNMLDKAIQMID